MPNTNIYDVYIQHWYNNSTGRPDAGSEKLMFSIPYSNPEGFPVVSPSVKCSEDSADSFDFTLNAGMEYYDLLIPFITLIRVKYYGNTIFYGRVLTINPSTILQTKSIHCEGAYAFMNDSFYPAIADSKREELDWVNSSNNGYFDKILSNHNTYINGDEHKKFYKGTIDSSLSGKKKKYEPTGWSQTTSLLSSLKDEIGGHMLARYSGGYNYLDWYKYAKRDLGNNRPRIEVGENVIDISGNMDVGNLFTRVIPVGKNDNDGTKMSIAGYKFTNVRTGQEETIQTDFMQVSTVLKLYQDSDLTNDYHTPGDFVNSEAQYGIIYKTVQFSDAATQKELFEECAKWIKESYYGAVTSFEIRAIDMKITNSSATEPILIGDCVDIYYKIMENGQMVTKYRKMIAKSIKYDLFNPSNNSYSFGIPSDLLKTSKSQTTSNKKKTVSETMSNPEEDESEPDKNLTFRKIADIIRNDPDVANGYGGDAAADSFIENGEYSGSTKVYDAFVHYDPIGHPEICFTARIAGKITLSGKQTKWVAFNSAHGLFAYTSTSTPTVSGESASINSSLASALAVADQTFSNVPKGITHWYVKNDGYTYTNIASLTASTKNGAISGAANFVLSDLTKQFYMHSAVEGGMISGMMTIDPQALNKVKVKRTMLTSATKGALTFLNAEIDKQNTITAFFGNKDDNSGGSMQIMDDAEKKIAEITKSIDGGGFLNLLSSNGINSIQALADDVKNRITTSAKKSGTNVSTTTIDGAVGSMCSIFGKLGIDGSGDDSKTTIINNGNTGNSTFFDLNGGSSGNTRKKTIELAAGSSAMSFFNGKTNENDKKTVEVEGNGTSGEGKINVGGKGNGDWRVQLNNKVTYTDEHGDTYTLPGFVTAEDFSMLQSIPSFKTKYAVVDTLIAGKVTASTIQADLAYIRDLSSDTIKANRSVRAGAGYFTNGYTTNMHASNYFVAGEDGWSSGGNLLSCVNGADPVSVDSNGKVTITLKRIGSGSDIVLTFNQAATTFYKNAVAASYDSDHSMFISGAGSFNKLTTATLNPGESHNYWPTFAKKSGGYQSGELIKVTARSLNLQAKSVAPTTTAQTITADSGRDGLSSVNVSAATKQAKTVSASTSSSVEVTADAGYYGLSKVTVNQFKVQSKTVTPGKDAKVILPDSGYNALSNVSLNGDADLVAGNIKSGVSIFGVTGTYSADVDRISLWDGTGTGSSEWTAGDYNITQKNTIVAYCRVNGSWKSGTTITVSPKPPISITVDATGHTDEPDGTEIYSDTNFVKNKWYVFTVKAGNSTKVYKIQATY